MTSGLRNITDNSYMKHATDGTRHIRPDSLGQSGGVTGSSGNPVGAEDSAVVVACPLPLRPG